MVDPTVTMPFHSNSSGGTDVRRAFGTCPRTAGEEEGKRESARCEAGEGVGCGGVRSPLDLTRTTFLFTILSSVSRENSHPEEGTAPSPLNVSFVTIREG